MPVTQTRRENLLKPESISGKIKHNEQADL